MHRILLGLGAILAVVTLDCKATTRSPSIASPTQVVATTSATDNVTRGALPANRDDCPPSYPIKGNRGASVWIYHVPSGRSYRVVDPEECFATVQDAEASGYRRALR